MQRRAMPTTLRFGGQFVRGAALVAALAGVAAPAISPAFAQSPFPSKPIQLVVPYPPGGSDASKLGLEKQ